jgi:2'-5' RNA ligase
MSAIEFALEGRPFRPHSTIGRVARGARRSDFKELRRDLEELDFLEEANIASVDVMQSVLSSDGPRYTRLAAVELGR